MSSRRARSALLSRLLFTLLLALAPLHGALAAKGDCDSSNQASWPVCETGNLCLCAADDVEYRADKVLLNDVVLYQGGSPLLVRAQHAETPSIDFTDSTWNLSGGVTSRLAQGKLESDNAIVHIKKGDLSAATFRGAPATFEESAALTAKPGASVTNVHGSAKTIDYDSQSGGEVRMIGDVQLYDGCKEIHGSGFVYNLAQKSLKSIEPAAGVSRERVRGTFQRGCKPQAPGAAPSAAPSTAPAPAPAPPATAPATAPPANPPAAPAVIPKAAPWATGSS
ncbi:MAG TPA: LptA/OstA family protein [Steroidobacteraceae bacterium]|nr:LptA/OstA family protein [Steroidobacteraceae bacterium]